MPTILITGANRGFGFLLAELYAQDDWNVIACCRTPEKAEALQELALKFPNHVAMYTLDVTNFDQVDQLAAELEGTAIDVLLNNAGILGKHTMEQGAIPYQAFGKSDFDEWEMTIRINAMAPMKMAEAFVDHVAASEQKKIVTLTSIIGSVGANNFGGFYAYRASKSAANAIMKSMGIDLAARGITAFPVHPGYAKTDMGGATADIEPIEGALGVKEVITKAGPDYAGRIKA